MAPKDTPAGWRDWEARADDPEIQKLIREAIRRGEIRVVPRPGGGIRIIPQDRRTVPPLGPDREG
jgi:hypothetical protein